MMFPKVFILTLLIVGTFAKGSIKNMEERIEAFENNIEERIFEKMEERIEAFERKLTAWLVTEVNSC